MQNRLSGTIKQLAFVFLALALLAVLAQVGVGYAAPGFQGTVPPPPGGTPVPPTPAPLPQGLGGPCCLPGIAFDSTRDGNLEIYVMRSDGTAVTRLTVNPAIDQDPAPSRDGTRIAFQSTRDDPNVSTCGQAGQPNCITHIYSMNVDGTGQTRLTNGAWRDIDPNWSNGMSRIIFVSNRDDPNPLTCGQPGKPNCVTNIYAMNPDGTGVTRLTSNPPNVPAANTFPNWAPDDTQIAFVSTRDDPNPATCGQSGQPACITHIYVMKYDGTNVTRLTNNSAADGHPAWSPDGTQLVFETNRDGNFQLYLINADGTNQVRLTNVAADDRHPIWIPGCEDRIVFASNRDGGGFRIYAIDPDGKSITRLTNPPAGVNDDYPAWSGLPASIALPGPCCVPGVAFDSLRDGNSEIYIMRADGSRQTRLTFNSAADQNPAPAPDGVHIAFQSNRDGPFHIYVMNVDGSGVTRLTNTSGNDIDPAWSNDGKHIAFVSDRSGAMQIYVMNTDGTGVAQVTTNPSSAPNAANTNPLWSPDNKQIVFQSNRDGNDEVYVINADGSGLTRLTNNPASDGHPSFSPDGKKIVFESNRDGKYQLYVMNSDGSNQTRITNDSGDDRYPYWCPTCIDRITFTSTRDGVSSIYTTNSDGSTQIRLTVQAAGVTAPDSNPAWSGLPILRPVPILLPALTSPAATPTPGS
jgi:Tol biopolymer transport system component